MTPHQIKRRGQTVWTIDARSEAARKLGRFSAPTKQEVIEKHKQADRAALLGIEHVEFNDEDKLAKRELGDRGTLLQAVRAFLAQKPCAKKQTIAAAVTECLEAKKKLNLRPAYITHLRWVLGQFKSYVGADALCSEVQSHHVRDFLHSGGWEAITISAMRKRLSTFFAWCADHGYIAETPVNKSVKTPRVDKKRPVILTPSQCEKLLRTALTTDRALLPYFALGLFCGLRPEEIKRLPVASVRLSEALVDVPASVSKTRDRRLVELSANAIAWLTAANGCKTVDGRYISYRKHRTAIAVAAGIEWSADVMRHSFASYHIAMHDSADKTARQLGHMGSTQMLFRHYAATVTRAEAQQFWNLVPPPIVSIVPKENAA